MDTFIYRAYAKVNLLLAVLSRRPDGFHEVKTILQNVDLFDVLTFKKNDTLCLESNLKLEPKENLVYKAALLLASHSKNKLGAHIYLEKNIPISAGLGGGSADAAATIIALNKLWDLNLSDEKIFEAGAKIGSDVNFFLKGGMALATSKGEKIKKINQKLGLNVVIIKPDFGISAKEAYLEWDKEKMTRLKTAEESIDRIMKGDFEPSDMTNDLEGPVLKKYPKIKEFYELAKENGAEKVMLSGSGSAFIALGSEEAQNKIHEVFTGRGIKSYKVKTINKGVELIES